MRYAGGILPQFSEFVLGYKEVTCFISLNSLDDKPFATNL